MTNDWKVREQSFVLTIAFVVTIDPDDEWI